MKKCYQSNFIINVKDSVSVSPKYPVTLDLRKHNVKAGPVSIQLQFQGKSSVNVNLVSSKSVYSVFNDESNDN